MGKALDLTEAQKSQMLDFHLQLRKDLLPLKSEQEKLRADLKMEMTTEKFSEAKLKKIVDQISNLQTEMQMKRLMNQRAVRNLLTEEQKKKFDLHVLSRELRGKHRGQRNFRRHPGPMRSEEVPED
jgi:Spy/CpxP family protein refolding chaperone